MTHIEMQILVAAILTAGGLRTSGPDHTPDKMIERFKEVLAEVQKSQAVPPLRR